MKFKKIGEDKIRCVITKEEMEQNGMELGDFVSDQEKTQSFIRDILAEACETLGIETHAKAYSVQMTVMPQGDVALLISPDSSSGLATAIEELKKHLTGLQETLSTTKSTPPAISASTADVPVQNATALRDDKDEVTDQYLDTPLWAILPDLDASIELCKHIPKYDGIKSSLYRYGDDYYVKLNFKLTRRQISAVILVIAEFASQMFTESFDGAFLLEHGDLICDDCVNVLSQI